MTIIKSVVSKVFDCFVIVALLFLMLVVLVGFPLELVIESYGMLQMRATGQGQITRSEVINQGELSRSVVEYKFSVGDN